MLVYQKMLVYQIRPTGLSNEVHKLIKMAIL